MRPTRERQMADQLLTFRQTVPQLVRVLRNMRPTYHFTSVASLNASFFEDNALAGGIWDIDGTLMAYHAEDVAPEFRTQIRALFRRGPGRHVILSNSGENRFRALGSIFPEIPVIRGYQTSAGPVRRCILGGVDTHSRAEIDDILKGGGQQIRKPSGQLIRFAMEEIGVDDPRQVVMVGDQYLTDVASANLAGALSVKVRTYQRESFPLNIRLSQRLEGLVYGLLHGGKNRRIANKE